MRKFYFLLISLMFSIFGFAQVAVTVTGATNTTPNLSASYTSLANALTALSGVTAFSGPVTLTCAAGTETAPAGGYVINYTGATSSSNNVVIVGTGVTITAAAAQTAGSLNDAIFKIIGSDWVTIQGFTMQENSANTTTGTSATFATNNMTEWGIALLYDSPTNGAQNNTILGNTISLNRNYSNTCGIYSNTRHSATLPTTSAEATSAAGSNSGNKIYSNSISNLNYGIVFVGSGTTAAVMDYNNDIGGTSSTSGNTITNWGGLVSGAASNYPSLTSSSTCISMLHQVGDNVSYNTLVSATITTLTTSQVNGIIKSYTVGQPTGQTFTSTYNNNTITLSNSPTTGQMTGMGLQGLTALSTATFNCNNNLIVNCVISGASATSATFIGMLHSSAPGTFNISNNTIRGVSTTSTTGGFVGIQQQTNGVVTALNITNNKIGDATAGAVTFQNANSAANSFVGISITSTGASSSCATTITGNDIRGITHAVAGSGAHVYIGNSSSSLSQNISNNTFTNLNVNTTGSVTFIVNTVTVPAAGSKTINSNSIVTAFNKAGAGGTVTLYGDAGSSTCTTPTQNNNNNFSNITVTGATTIAGWSNTDGTGSTPKKEFSGNTFTNWTGGTSAVTGLNVTWGNPSLISNNTINNISGQGAIIGITTGGSAVFATPLTVTGNTVTNLSSTGTAGNVTGLTFVGAAPTSGTHSITNNVINTLSSTSTTGTVAGISSSGSTVNISGHTIYGLSTVSSTSGAANGIMVTGGNNVSVFKNKIYNLTASGAFTTGPGVNGIVLSGTTTGATVNVFNNLIGDLKAPAANSTDAVRGLSVTATGTNANYNISYNTISITASSAGANFGTTGVFHAASTTSTTAALAMRNNIIANNSTASGTGLTAAYRRSSTSLNNYLLSSTNNNFWAGTPSASSLIFSDGTNADQTLSAFQARVSSREGGSISENPAFISTTGSNVNFLRPDPTIPTQIESGGIPIVGITMDYDDDTRNANIPDMGADEFNGITPKPTLSAVTILPTGNQCVATARSVSVTATTAIGTITSVILSYSINGVAQTPITMTNSSGNIWVAAIPASATGLVQWTVTATNSASLTYSMSGTSYRDDVPSTYTPSPITFTPTSPVCLTGSSAQSISAAGGTLNAVTILSEDFNGTASSWTRTNNSTGGTPALAAWTLRPSGYVYSTYGAFSSNDNTQFILSNSDEQGSGGTTATILVSPSFSTVGFSTVSVSFFHYFREAGTANVEASLDGTNWTLLRSFTSSTSSSINFTNANIALTSAFLNQPTVYIRFKYDASWQYFWGIDNVVISGSVPTSIVWSPSGPTSGLFTDAAATSSYAGDATNMVYALPTSAQTYQATASYGLGCGTRSASIIVAPLLTTHTVTGGGAYCSGGAGVAIGLSGSTVGVNYQLQLSGVNVGSAVAGTGNAITFGNQTAAGNYTVVATDALAGCTLNMTGSATVSINALPTPSITVAETSGTANNDGTICAGASASLTASGGVSYLWAPGGATTAAITVSPSATTTYTATATDANGCSADASATITVNPLPTAYAVTGGGAYCSGGVGVGVGISSSDIGISYELYLDGTATGTTATGTGSAISFGTFTTAGTYTVVATNTATGCTNNMTGSVAVSINPLPVISRTLTEPTTCISTDGAINLTISGAAGPYTYNWTGTGVAAAQEDQTGIRVGTYSVVVTAANGCQATANYTLLGPGGCDVCPTIGAVVTNPVAVCQDGTAALNATGLTDLGVSYGISFVVSATPLANPYTGTVVATVPNGSLGVTTAGPPVVNNATANYTFTTAGTMYVYAILSPAPVDPSCRPFKATQINVVATPNVNDVTNVTVCPGATTAPINFSGTVPGTTYSWTSNNTSIGIAASGTGNIGSFTATNFTNTPVTATITVTPNNTFNIAGSGSALTCPGPSKTFTITVNPRPTVNTVTNFAACNGATVSVPFSGFVPGTVYEWTNSNTAIGLAASGTGSLSFTATNSGTAPISANIIVTPKYTNNGVTCTGAPIAFTITINPTPTVNAVSNQVVCNSGATTAVSFSGTVPGTVYNWTNSAPSIGLLASGTGNIASFTAVNTGTSPVTATITVTPSYTNGGTTCDGTATTFTIIVNPTAQVNAVTNQTVCNGDNTTAINFTTANTGGTTTYSWTNDTPSIGLLASGTGNIAAFAATNTGTSPVTATITVTPSYTNGGQTCTGTARTFTITVNPTPTAVATPASQTICSATAITNIVLTGSVTGTTYSWTRNNTTSVTGIAASGTGNITGTLTNTTNAPVTVTFTITPSANGCTGTAITATVVVNPTPNAVSTPASQTICSATAITNIVLTGNVTGTTYSWTRDNTTPVTGIAVSGTGNITGTLTNTTNAPVTVTFTITPSANGCTGTAITATVVVNPTPNVVATPASQTICSATAISNIVLTGNVTGTTYSWTRNNTTSVTGIAASGTGNITGTLTNTTNAPVTVTFTITPSANGCTGTPITATVLVNPTPNAVATPAAQTICTGSAISNIVLSGNVAGTTYAWTRDNTTAVTGIAASGSGNITGTLTNTTNAPVTVTFTITPSANGCAGASITATVIVNPIPTVNAINNQVVCNRASTTAIAFSGAVTGTVYNWSNNTPSIGLAASGVGDIAAFTAVNTTQTPVVATITVTPTYTNGGVTCTGTPRTFTITVNPTPIVTATDLFTRRICISDGPVALNATPVGGSWSGNGVSGFNFIPAASAVGRFVLTYTFTNQFGCTSTDTTTAIVSACDERNRSLENRGAFIYPNPNDGQFNIRINSTRFQFLQMRIYNSAGQLVSTKQWNGLVFGQNLPVDMRHLAAGMYSVRLIYDGGNLYEDKAYQMLITH